MPAAMYAKFFGLRHEPFSIAPDPRYLYMSERHREALAHLLYGLKGGGGFVLLSGEIGAGKTTVCRCFLEQIPRRCNVAYIFNPKLTVEELLQTVCAEFGVPSAHEGPGQPTAKDHVDALNQFLLRTHAVGQNNVLIIDEAQNLSAEVLEQLRLLTNLETSERKLLQIVLIGQPELRDLLARPELEQLAQRVIARFHLEALSENETAHYIQHRLAVAGWGGAPLFDRASMQRIHTISRGVPRRINLLCDRALLGAYAVGRSRVEVDIVNKAAVEVFGARAAPSGWRAWWRRAALAGTGLAAGGVLLALMPWSTGEGSRRAGTTSHVVRAASAPASSTPASAVRVALPASSAASAASVGAISASAAGISASAPMAAYPWPPGYHSEREAWRELAEAWSLDAGEGDPCQAAPREQLQCFRQPSVTLALVRQLGRPGIVSLRERGDQVTYALLTGLDADHATLRMGSVTHTVPLPILAERWRGDFATLWRTPPGYARSPADGDAGPVVEWLALKLAALRGEPAPGGPKVFDAALRARIHAFQLAQGLEADGRPGPMTFMQINRASGVEEPRLAPTGR
jgi:general secretion pathway protein A